MAEAERRVSAQGSCLRMGKPPLVIAHRGASGYRPEHTRAAYALAMEQGADFIEPDLVISKDGVLIARHENNIAETTDVAEKFPGRRATKQIDGQTITGFFTEDFTLAELKTLRAKERLPLLRGTGFDGQLEVLTLEEILHMVEERAAQTGQRVGLYVELKHPRYFAGLGLALEERLATALEQHGAAAWAERLFVQSFEAECLRALRRRLGSWVQLVQLIERPGKGADDAARMLTGAGLHEVATYANGIGPDKSLLRPADEAAAGEPPTLLREAHARGLCVHPWTFRKEPAFVGPGYGGSLEHELRAYYRAGVDGVFCDFPDVAVSSRSEMQQRVP